jgi:alkylated DNA nucleotide flippase Atl1
LEKALLVLVRVPSEFNDSVSIQMATFNSPNRITNSFDLFSFIIVGGALRKNPFAPAAPCHRVIASNLFIGGFMGEWGKGNNTNPTKTKLETGTSDLKHMCDKKLDLLAAEGVAFDKRGILKSRTYLWDGKV